MQPTKQEARNGLGNSSQGAIFKYPKHHESPIIPFEDRPLDLSHRCRNTSYSCQRPSIQSQHPTPPPTGQRRSNSDDDANHRMRRHHEMTPANAKDPDYWQRRTKNNAAARRSRRSRRAREAELARYAAHLEKRNAELTTENRTLRAELLAHQMDRSIDGS